MPRLCLAQFNPQVAPNPPEYFALLMRRRPCGGLSGSHVLSRRVWREAIMSYNGSGNASGWNQGGGPDYRHAFDPYLEPELFRSVLTRRVIAFIIDLFILAGPIALAVIFIPGFGPG